MSSSSYQLDRIYPPRAGDDSDPDSWSYECTMWQDDQIMGRLRPCVIRPWRDYELFGEIDSSTEPLPPDVFVILFRYNCDHVFHAEDESSLVGGYREEKGCCCWMKKSCIIGDNDDELLYTMKRLREIISSFEPYIRCYDLDRIAMMIIAYAQRIGEENWNNGREGVSCVCDVSATHIIHEDVEITDSVEAIVTNIEDGADDDYDEGLIEENSIDIATISESAARLVIDSLPKAEIKASGNESCCPVSGYCAVCWDEISIGDEVIWMPCSHFYHGRCITEWLLRKNTCPLCRFVLKLETEVNEGTEET